MQTICVTPLVRYKSGGPTATAASYSSRTCTGSGGYNLGDRVSGGSFNAVSGTHYASPLSGGHGFFGGHGISRGGFGHSFGSGS